MADRPAPPPNSHRFYPDAAHNAAGGGDPAEIIRRYADRVRRIHPKDVRLDPLQFLPVAAGIDPSAAESDGWTPIRLSTP